MQYTTKTFSLAIATMTAGVVALAAAHSIRTKAQGVSSPSSDGSALKSPTKAVAVVGNATKSRNEKFQREMEEANRRESIANKKAQQLFEQGRLAEAEQACYDALAVSLKINGEPTDTTAMQLLGDVYREQKRYKEAIEVYGNSLKHGIGDDDVPLNIAWCYLKLGDLKNAHQFYSEEKFFADLPPAQKAMYIISLPGTKTPKTMEASLLFALGCEKSGHADVDNSVPYFKKALLIVPHNALIAYKCARDLARFSRKEEAVPYWARAVVFGKGFIAEESLIDLHNYLMPDKVEQALSEAKKIK